MEGIANGDGGVVQIVYPFPWFLILGSTYIKRAKWSIILAEME